MATNTSANHAAPFVRLAVPRALEYVPLIRVMVAGYAARLGFDVDKIADSRIAVEEFARVLVEAGVGATIDVVLAGADRRLEIEGTTTCLSDAGAPQLDPSTSPMLSAICDDYLVFIDHGAVCFRAAIVRSALR